MDPVYVADDSSEETDNDNYIELQTKTISEIKKEHPKIEVFEFFAPSFLKINII